MGEDHAGFWIWNSENATLLGTSTKIVLVGGPLHKFGVPRLGPWITWVNRVGATPTATMCASLSLAVMLHIGRGYVGLWARRTPSGAYGERPYPRSRSIPWRHSCRLLCSVPLERSLPTSSKAGP